MTPTTSTPDELGVAHGSACCERCARAGILVCQYVIPNKYSDTEKDFRFAPWIFRYHLCRYHLAVENRPQHRRKVGGKKRVRVVWKPDSELIAEWIRDQKPTGGLTKEGGWQKLNDKDQAQPENQNQPSKT